METARDAMLPTVASGDGERIRLFGWSDKIETPVLSLMFGEMVKRSMGVVEQYQSDLYHDAQWLERNVIGPCVFFWGPRTWGTVIGMDRALVFHNSPQGLIPYRVTLECERGCWYVTFDRETI